MPKLKITDPPVKEIYKGKTPADTTADVRDSLSYFAGRGLTNLVDPEAQKQYALLVNQVGREKAQNLANQVFLHSQRPEVLKMSPEQRISSFYSVGSNNPDVQGTLNKVKSFGMGVIPGFRSSPLLGNMLLGGRESAPIAAVKPDTDQQKRVKLLISQIGK